MTTGTTSSHSARAPFPGVPAPSPTQRSSPDRPRDLGAGSSDEPSFDDVFEFESGAGRSSRRVRGDEKQLEADENRDEASEDVAAAATDALGVPPMLATGESAQSTADAAPDAVLQEHVASDSDTLIDPAAPLGAAAPRPATGSTTDVAAVDPADVVPSDADSADLSAHPDAADSIPAGPIGPRPGGSAEVAPDTSGATGPRSPTLVEQAGLAVAPTASTGSSPASAAVASAPASSVAADQLRNTEMVRRSDLQRLGAMTRIGVDITTDELGAVRVEALDRSGALHMTLSSDDGATRQMLADRSRELRESLGENLASFDVDPRSGDERRRQQTHDRSGETGASSIEPTSATTSTAGASSAAAAAIDGPLDLRL